MSFNYRWPLRGTRGFSATPRRGFTRGRQALSAPSKQTAKRIVRRAGPLESAFFCNSNLFSAGVIPATYVGAAVQQGDNVFPLFDSSDWTTSTVSNRAKVLIKRLTYTAFLTANPGSSDLGFHLKMNACLLIGRPDDISDDVTTPRAFPWGEQSSLIAFQDLSRRTVRFRARKMFDMYTPGTYQNATGEEILTSQLVGMQRTTRRLTLTLRNTWMNQNEAIRVLFSHIKEGQGLDPVNQSGSVTGWHNLLIQYATY